MSPERLFQILGPVTATDRSPTVTGHGDRTSSRLVDNDRGRLRGCMSATRRIRSDRCWGNEAPCREDLGGRLPPAKTGFARVHVASGGRQEWGCTGYPVPVGRISGLFLNPVPAPVPAKTVPGTGYLSRIVLGPFWQLVELSSPSEWAPYCDAMLEWVAECI